MSKTALLFAGQGAQYVGMGKDLADHFSCAQEIAAKADATLGYNISDLCFNGPETELMRTEHAQPAIYLVCWMAFDVLRRSVPDLEFGAAAGLSLGEYGALAAAGAVDFLDGLLLVRQRGLFMQEACLEAAGGMAAIIGMGEPEVRRLCEESGVQIANLNCPGQIVISGLAAGVETACKLAKERGAKRAVKLQVAGAFHSCLMASAREKLEGELGRYRINAPSVPVISNVTARPHGTPDKILALMAEQVTSPVRWEDSMRYLIGQGFTRFIELGPGTVLSGFLRRIAPDVEVFNVEDVPSLERTVNSIKS
ncbi:MAG: ACP S-malonyltransferase [Verrucomicrobiae bacterium]|nr:ACP S-malonyltransferase [Verrucomicrobiae bacterium]